MSYIVVFSPSPIGGPGVGGNFGDRGTWGMGGRGDGGNMNWWLAASRVLTQDHQLLHSFMKTLYASGADIMVGSDIMF